MANTTFIYALCEPNSRTVRYIGKADDVKKRFREHIRDSAKKWSPLGRWLRSLVLRGEQPNLVVLREVRFDHWELAEERFIRLARGCGMKLVNATDGGDCGPVMTGRAHPLFGKPRSPETRAKIAAGRLGLKASPGTRAKMSAAKRGKSLPDRTPEHCAALSASLQSIQCSSGDKNPMFGKTGQKSPHFGKKNPNASSPFLGVYLKSSNGMWVSRIRCEGREYYLGAFSFEKEAALAYDSKATLLYGPSAKLNFPEADVR